MSSNSCVTSNSLDSFYGNDSVDSKITLPKNIADVVMEHGVTLDEEDEIACIYCEYYVTTRGVYQFLCHLAGTETKPCDGVSEEVKNEMLEILTLSMSSKSTFVDSNPSGSFYGDVSMDSKKTESKNVADVILEHSVQLDGDEIGCRFCDVDLSTRGCYYFLCHLVGTENGVKGCEGIGKDAKKEVLNIFRAFQKSVLEEINEEGCVRVGEKRICHEVAVESSKDIFKKRRMASGSEAIAKNKIEEIYGDNDCTQ